MVDQPVTPDLSRMMTSVVGSLDRASAMWRKIVERGRPAQVEPEEAAEMADYFDAMRLTLTEIDARVVTRVAEASAMIHEQIASYGRMAAVFATLAEMDSDPERKALFIDLGRHATTLGRAAALAMMGAPQDEPAPARPKLALATIDGKEVS